MMIVMEEIGYNAYEHSLNCLCNIYLNKKYSKIESLLNKDTITRMGEKATDEKKIFVNSVADKVLSYWVNKQRLTLLYIKTKKPIKM